MKWKSISFFILVAACILLLVQPLQAQGEDATVIYQTSFDSNPSWITNNPSNDYWDPSLAMYHFSLEPSTGNYAYIPVEYEKGSFTLDYDVILTRVDEGTTFRLGFSGKEMDPSKGPNVLTQFTNAKYGQIMWLHLVTFSNKMQDINSQRLATELGPGAYDGPTVNYALNKTYHVTVNYDDEHKTLSMKVNEKLTGKEIWGYYMTTSDNLHGMNRIYIGSKGDYGMMNRYAQGYIDNVRLTVPAEVLPVSTETSSIPTTVAVKTTKPTPKPTTVVPTAIPTGTPQSPSSAVLVIAGLAIVGTCSLLGMRKIR